MQPRSPEPGRDALRLAEELAAGGRDGVVGVVSIVDEVGVEEIPVFLHPEVWSRLAELHPQALSLGYIYAVLDSRTHSLMLATVSEARMVTPQSRLHSRSIVPPAPRPRSETPEPILDSELLRATRLLLLLRPMASLRLPEESDPLRAVEQAPVESVAAPPAPGSPVFIPRPEVVERALLSVRVGEGDPLLGYLGIMDRVYQVPGGKKLVPLRLPWSVLVKHILVTGTTGAGKTSLVKNLALNVVSKGRARVVFLDASGDFVAAAMPGYIPPPLLDPQRYPLRLEILAGYAALGGASSEALQGLYIPSLIVIPWHRDDDFGEVCSAYRGRLEEVAKSIYTRHGLPAPRVEQLDDDEARKNLVCAYRVTVEIGGSEKRAVVYAAPRSIELERRGPYRIAWLAAIDPFFTERAKDELRRLERKFEEDQSRQAASLAEFYAWLEKKSAEKGALKDFHHQTLNLIKRRLEHWVSSGIVDAGKKDLKYEELTSFMDKRGLRGLILDLEYASSYVVDKGGEIEEDAVKLLLGAKLLQGIARGVVGSEAYTLIVIDEAHLFFPARRSGGEGYPETLASLIRRLARLGRSRGIGIIFSTHREDDVDELIVTLSNTKIYFRTDTRTAEQLRIPAELKNRLPYFADYAAVVQSYYLRGGYATIISGPALPGHRTA